MPSVAGVVAKYIESGLLANEKVLYIADKATPEEILQSFTELDVDVQAKTAGLTLSGAPSIYYPKGTFSTEEMLDMTRAFYRQAVENEGFDGARGIGEMSWCLVKGRVDEATLMEYEARLTLLLDELPYTACCQYDARRFDGAVLLDVMSIHPVMIVHGQLVKNPFYIEPQTFMDEYNSRLKGHAL